MAGKRPRCDKRVSEGLRANLYPAETTLGWRVIRSVSVGVAREKVALGEWREVIQDWNGALAYQMVATFKSEKDLPSGASSSSITVRECMMNAGLMGDSHTMGMPEERRISRRHPMNGRALPPEDAMERARAKVAEWPLMHGDRAVRVYPKSA